MAMTVTPEQIDGLRRELEEERRANAQLLQRLAQQLYEELARLRKQSEYYARALSELDHRPAETTESGYDRFNAVPGGVTIYPDSGPGRPPGY